MAQDGDQAHDRQTLLIHQGDAAGGLHARPGDADEAGLRSQFPQGADKAGRQLVAGGLVGDDADAHPGARVQRTKPRGLLATKSARRSTSGLPRARMATRASSSRCRDL